MLQPITTHSRYVELAGVKDDAMRLTEVRTIFLSAHQEGLAVVFRDHREVPQYPDISFAIAYPRTWSREQVRMDLFAQLALAEKAYSASRAEAS
jgi:hypothetical protein